MPPSKGADIPAQCPPQEGYNAAIDMVLIFHGLAMSIKIKRRRRYRALLLRNLYNPRSARLADPLFLKVSPYSHCLETSKATMRFSASAGAPKGSASTGMHIFTVPACWGR